MRYRTVVAIICTVALPAQAPAKPQETAAPSKVAAELTKTVQLLDVVMADATSTIENARNAARQAEAAKAQAKAESKEPVEELTGDTHQNLQALVAAMEAHLGVVKAQRDKLAAAIPPLETLGDRVRDAEKMPKLLDAEKALKAIEEEIAKEGGQAEPLAWVRYRLSHVMRQRAELEIKLNKHHEAEQILRRTISKLGEVIEGPDATDTPDGSSLQASALRWSVYCNTIIADAYWDRDANVARKCFTEATKAVERLGRVHPSATLHDGTLAIDAAKSDMDRLRQRHPPR